VIDEPLIWNTQVDKITKKVNLGLSILSRLRVIVDYQTLITIYLSIIQPRFDCCTLVWGSLRKGLSHKLQKLQNTLLEMKDSMAAGFVKICADLTNFINSRWRKYRALIV
jgi:hypothetical protein